MTQLTTRFNFILHLDKTYVVTKDEPCLIPGGTSIIGHGRTPSKAHGIFLENAHNVQFKGDIKFEFESPRKSWFGNCIEKDEYSTNIDGLDIVKCVNGGGEEML